MQKKISKFEREETRATEANFYTREFFFFWHRIFSKYIQKDSLLFQFCSVTIRCIFSAPGGHYFKFFSLVIFWGGQTPPGASIFRGASITRPPQPSNLKKKKERKCHNIGKTCELNYWGYQYKTNSSQKNNWKGPLALEIRLLKVLLQCTTTSMCSVWTIWNLSGRVCNEPFFRLWT